MIGQGLALTAIGMSFVFLFLALLILAMNVLAKAVRVLEAHYPEKVVAAAPTGSSAGISSGHDESEIALAIAAAGAFTHKR